MRLDPKHRRATLFTPLVTVVALTVACGSPEVPVADAPEEEPAVAVSRATTHLGGCVLRAPVGEVPADLYATSEVVRSGTYAPFTKELTTHGLVLVARDEASDDFMRLVARTIGEIFTPGDGTDRAAQEEVLSNLYRYRALVPVPKGQDMSFAAVDPQLWAALEGSNSVCDIIMQDVPGQVMEVIEHILHYVTDLGLHYAFPADWGLEGDSVLRRAMDRAIEDGHYGIAGYDDIDDPSVRDRVLMQEFAYWVITTAWDLQRDYGPREEEWTVTGPDDLAAKLPEMWDAYQRTVVTTMRPPSAATLREIGPTRAEEAAATGGTSATP